MSRNKFMNFIAFKSSNLHVSTVNSMAFSASHRIFVSVTYHIHESKAFCASHNVFTSVTQQTHEFNGVLFKSVHLYLCHVTISWISLCSSHRIFTSVPWVPWYSLQVIVSSYQSRNIFTSPRRSVQVIMSSSRSLNKLMSFMAFCSNHYIFTYVT